MQGKDIICVSTHYWYDAWFRKQQFMSRFLAAGHRVLYVQPAASMVRRAQGNPLARNRFLFGKTEKIDDHLYLYYPPWSLPKPANPLSATLNYKWQSLEVARAARNLGMRAPVLWLYRPEYSVGLKYIPCSSMVFDLVDDLSAYNKNLRAAEFIDKCTRDLIQQSSLFVTTSSVLLEKYGQACRRRALVSNGFDSNIFKIGKRDLPEPLANTRRPLVGFIGTLFGFLDYALIEYCVREHPDKTFVFVGEVEQSGADGVARLKKYSNTLFLGRRPKEEIPAYVASFDLCISPFKVDDVSRSVSPLKVYEYLAMGKPVVSAFMEGLSKDSAGPFVTFAKDKESFSKSIDSELLADSATAQQRRSRGVAGMSWNNLFEQLANDCKPLLQV